jgi:hypothetical protein
MWIVLHDAAVVVSAMAIELSACHEYGWGQRLDHDLSNRLPEGARVKLGQG